MFMVDHLADDTVGSGLTGSLRYAITNATDNDHITFSVTGTINLTGALPTLTHSISIEGPGAAQLTVRRNTGGNYGIFAVGSGATVSISGLSITNGYNPSLFGGGIDNLGTLTVSDCTISGNTAEGFGGGILNDGTLTVSHSTISGNSAYFGGGIGNGGTLTVTDSTISGNRANGPAQIGNGIGEGGGILNDDGTVVLNNSTISGNYATLNGGGLSNGSVAGGGVMTVSNCMISDNIASAASFEGGDYGGSAINNFGMMTVSNSTISGNGSPSTAPNEGGGILNQGEASMEITNSTIANNRASVGGGIYNLGEITVSGSTISGNRTFTTTARGGGIFIYPGGDLNMRNTILAGNSVATSRGDLFGSLSSSGHNLIGNTEGGGGFDPTDLLNVDPHLGPLQDNGGLTQTMALLPGSPALNAGDATQLGTADQRGVVRSGGVNIGAYQASASAFVLTAPAMVAAGTAFDLTVQAVDPLDQTALGYRGTAHFSSSDPLTVPQDLPDNYTFTSADAGMHTFTSGVTLKTAGNQSVTATDTATASITGTATVALTPAAADHFVISVPSSVSSDTPFDVTVTVVDAYGNTVPTYVGMVHFSSTDPDPGIILPPDYTFQASDGGSHVFAAGVTLITPGDETLTVTDTSSGLSGMITMHL
jgi:hypothetical protein